jgi:uncharacterized protein YfaS (alpha-2-macroglobulin family)
MSSGTDHVIDQVDDYLHNLLSEDEANHLERHCEACPRCQAALTEARRRREAVRVVPPVEASEELIQATVARVKAEVRRPGRLLRRTIYYLAGALAASVLLLAGLHIWTANLTASPYDLVVLGQRDLLATAMSSLRLRLVERPSGQPQAGVPVTVELRTWDGRQSVQLASVTTDTHGGGEPRFQLPDWASGDYELRLTAQTKSGPEVLSKGVSIKRSWQLMLTSDKPVYQPDQTIHVRALTLRRPDLKPVAKQPAVFTITDAKNNLIFKRTQDTSDFGIAAADCQLATEILEGTYTIGCQVGNTDSKLQVQVQKYVLPKFKVALSMDRPYYEPGDTVRCTLNAGYFFGKPVTEAAVAVTVGLEPGQHVIKVPALKTNDRGEAVVEFVIPKNHPGLVPGLSDYRLIIQAEVTDVAGQKQLGSTERVVTTRPVRLEVLPEGGTLVEGMINKVYLLLTRANGTPIQARLRIQGHSDTLQTDAQGTAVFHLTPRTQETRLIIRALDAEGNSLLPHREAVLYCGTGSADFLVRTDKAVYRGGDTLQLTALGAGTEPVFVDFIRQGKERLTLLSSTIAMSNGQGSHSLDLPPEVFGTLEICAYRINPDGQAVRKTRMVYIHPPGQVHIKTTLDQQEYRPGHKARLQFHLTDAQGRPVHSALSLAAVDEAVFSVLQQPMGLERSFYTVDQDFLKPVYALYPWSPEGGRRAMSRDFEQALFAATARTGAIPELVPPLSSLRKPTMAWKQPATVSPPAEASHSLAVTSHPAKVQKTAALRDQRLNWISLGWVGAVCLGLLTVYLCLWAFVNTREVLIIHLVGLIFLVPLAGLAGLIFVVGTGSKATFDTVGSSIGFAPASRAPVAEATINWAGPPKKVDIDPKANPIAPGQGAGAAPAPRVRKEFPETLLWKPQMITDEQGRASLDLELADSITSWRLSASAVTAEGRLGASETPIKVFQPFFVDLNLPVALTRGDEVSVPVVVYNYLDKPQSVTLTLAEGKWFERVGAGEQKLDLTPGEVKAFYYTLKATQVGKHQLEVMAVASSGVSDALKRDIEVLPNGLPFEQVHNGNLQQPAEVALEVPQNPVPGSVKAQVKIYPSSFSQVVEGLENIFRMPSGCFEQTSSTTYPNVLALDYLKRTGQSRPELEARARHFVHLGYQRLLGFEVGGGGFDWFGHPPANQTLTAYGLMEFVDMARVHDVDPELIRRTRAWLLAKRQSDGSWKPEGHGLHEDVLRGGADADLARLACTAYVAWSVFGSGDVSQGSSTREYLIDHAHRQIQDPHVLALVCNALLALDPTGNDAKPYLDRLEFLKRTSADGRHTWWAQEPTARTTFHGAGRGGQVETTALAVLALLKGKAHPASASSALAWLVAQKDASGTWYSTQATVLSLKALLSATEKVERETERRITLALREKVIEEIVIPADQVDVVKQVDVSDKVGAGKQQLEIRESTKTGAGYQVSLRYHQESARPAEKTPLAIDVTYDKQELAVNEVLRAKARVSNGMAQPAAMVMLELPVPAGFVPVPDDFNALVRSNTIARFQVQPGRVLVYLRDLAIAQPLEVSYRLQARMPVKINVPAARVYEYYAPERQGQSQTAALVVTAAGGR